jgi:hypothetical protein
LKMGSRPVSRGSDAVLVTAARQVVMRGE